MDEFAKQNEVRYCPRPMKYMPQVDGMKVIVLTRGDLTDRLGIFSRTNNLCSDT